MNINRFPIQPLIIALIFLGYSCQKDDEIVNDILENSLVSVNMEKFNLSFGFSEVGDVRTFALRFEETSTWEVTCEKEIAEVIIYHENSGIVPEMIVCNGSYKQSEQIVFKKNVTYTMYVTDDQSSIVNSFLVNFKKLSDNTTAKSYPIDLVRAKVVSREPGRNAIFYEKASTLFVFTYSMQLKSLKFDSKTLECEDSQSVPLIADRILSMKVDEQNDFLYILADYNDEYQLYCYSILDGGRIRLDREIPSIREFIGNSRNDYVIIKSMCLDEEGDFLYMSMDNSQLSYIQNNVLLVIDLRNDVLEIHKKYDNFISLLDKMQISSGNKYWWGLNSGHLWRRELSDGQVGNHSEPYGLAYQETYDFHVNQDEVALCQSMTEYSSGQYLIYRIEPRNKLAEQKIFRGIGGYQVVRVPGSYIYISYPHEENAGYWVEIYDGENTPVGVISREFQGADPLAITAYGMQYSPKQSLLFVYCETGIFVVLHQESAYESI